MNRGIYPALAGAIILERRLDVLSHNVGNVHTTGFKKDVPAFGTILARVAGPPLAGIDLFPQLATVRPDFSQGALRQTGHPLDVALEGDGFFVVQTASGDRLFRGGRFVRHASGTLVTSTGDPVMGKKGPITLPPGEMTVDRTGTIRVNNVVVDQFRLVRAPEGTMLQKAGDLYWRMPEQTEPDPAVQVHQGMIEQSNVDASLDLVEMIKVTRGYEQMQKAIRTMDEMTGQAIQIGRIQR
ncbi:MAG: flagellar hook-basal body protein [Nitrospirae bacterium]|nr:MAG: flagellar hook-basal body protein [Nitrospirota bacterium]